MNQQVVDQRVLITSGNFFETLRSRAAFFMPAVMAILASIAVVTARIFAGGDHFISDGALMMLALASYLIAGAFYLTNLYSPFRFAEKLGVVMAVLGVFFNLSSWLVRWAAAYDREFKIFTDQGASPADMPWVFRYVPFANLYDLSLAFAFGAGLATILVIREKKFGIVAAISLPLAAIILVLARFIGSELIDLPPVLDSYWRPIHVGIASLSYGIALVCFAVAVLYLLKDGLEVEKMAVWSGLFCIAVFATISKSSVFMPATFGTYTASTFLENSRMSIPLRADLPYVGWFIAAAALTLLASMAFHLNFISQMKNSARRWGNYLLYLSLGLQAGAIGMLVYQIKTLGSVTTLINKAQYPKFAVWMLQQQNVAQEQINALGPQQLFDMSNTWVTENISRLHLSLNANPVELSALITAFTATLFIVIFGLKTERLRAMLPSTETLDGLMYKLAGTTFAGLALLLMTGAVWANESWGRYWGWDAKEVGALVAWLTYAGFLHSRIAYGWRGRRSAYFAVVAFLFVIFTYLGVSYLLPGLHSYA